MADQAAIDKVDAEIKAVNEELEALEAEIKAARAAHDEAEVTALRADKAQLRADKAQLRAEKAQLREEMFLLLKRQPGASSLRRTLQSRVQARARLTHGPRHSRAAHARLCSREQLYCAVHRAPGASDTAAAAARAPRILVFNHGKADAAGAGAD